MCCPVVGEYKNMSLLKRFWISEEDYQPLYWRIPYPYKTGFGDGEYEIKFSTAQKLINLFFSLISFIPLVFPIFFIYLLHDADNFEGMLFGLSIFTFVCLGFTAGIYDFLNVRLRHYVLLQMLLKHMSDNNLKFKAENE